MCIRDSLYTDDPNKNPDAAFIPLVRELTPELQAMGKGASSSVGTGGMSAKLAAAQIATGSGSDMLIANACDLNVIYRILEGEEMCIRDSRGASFRRYRNFGGQGRRTG